MMLRRDDGHDEVSIRLHGRHLPESPFVVDERFTTRWWNRYDWVGRGDRENVSAYLGEEEVARATLDDTIDLPHYPRFPKLGRVGLEIEFFEVASGLRGRGIGTAAVNALLATFPDRRFAALSEEADGFWASLGWHAYDGPPRYRTAFAQPARTRSASRPSGT